LRAQHGRNLAAEHALEVIERSWSVNSSCRSAVTRRVVARASTRDGGISVSIGGGVRVSFGRVHSAHP